eukprot:TRINITY_DN7609_c0_g1_i11.p1 TRINITY_DN7609_c0_g1~~TRINITY_DN7609_c0_g1_i11.p1  ORF type:complete len:1506 (+),score=198.38 TRINITY_DN7609_c0_g1_i11:134-4519(+)
MSMLSVASSWQRMHNIPCYLKPVVVPSEMPSTQVNMQAAAASSKQKAAKLTASDIKSKLLATTESVLGSSEDLWDTPLMDSGIDSLSAVEFRNRVAEDFEVSLPQTLIFDHPSVSAIACYLGDRLLVPDDSEVSQVESRAAPAQPDGAAAMLQSLPVRVAAQEVVQTRRTVDCIHSLQMLTSTSANQMWLGPVSQPLRSLSLFTGITGTKPGVQAVVRSCTTSPLDVRRSWSSADAVTCSLAQESKSFDPVLFIAFSSSSSIVGLARGAQYAVANAFISEATVWERCQAQAATNTCWGGIASTGLMSNTQDIGMLPARVFGKLFQSALELPVLGEPAIVFDMPTLQHMGYLLGVKIPPLRPTKALPSLGAPGRDETDRTTTKHVTPKSLEDVEDRVQMIAQETIKETDVALDSPLMDVGMDSLSAIALRNRLMEDFGMPSLTSTVLFDYPSLRALSQHIFETLGDDSNEAPLQKPPEAFAEGITTMGAARSVVLVDSAPQSVTASVRTSVRLKDHRARRTCKTRLRSVLQRLSPARAVHPERRSTCTAGVQAMTFTMMDSVSSFSVEARGQPINTTQMGKALSVNALLPLRVPHFQQMLLVSLPREVAECVSGGMLHLRAGSAVDVNSIEAPAGMSSSDCSSHSTASSKILCLGSWSRQHIPKKLFRAMARVLAAAPTCRVVTCYRSPNFPLQAGGQEKAAIAIEGAEKTTSAPPEFAGPQDVLRRVQEIAAEATGLDDLGVDAPLLDSGIDSLSAVGFRNALVAGFGLTSLPASLILDYPSLRELSDHLHEELLGKREATAEHIEDSVGEPFDERKEAQQIEKLTTVAVPAKRALTGKVQALVPGKTACIGGDKARCFVMAAKETGLCYRALPRNVGNKRRSQLLQLRTSTRRHGSKPAKIMVPPAVSMSLTQGCQPTDMAEGSTRDLLALRAYRLVLLDGRSSAQTTTGASQACACDVAVYQEPAASANHGLAQLLARLVFSTFGCLRAAAVHRPRPRQLTNKGQLQLPAVGASAINAGVPGNTVEAQISEPAIFEKVHELAIEATGSDDIAPDTPLMDAGLDSLQAVSFRNSLLANFGMSSLPATCIIDYPSLRELSSFLYSELKPAEDAAGEPASVDAEAQQIGSLTAPARPEKPVLTAEVQAVSRWRTAIIGRDRARLIGMRAKEIRLPYTACLQTICSRHRSRLSRMAYSTSTCRSSLSKTLTPAVPMPLLRPDRLPARPTKIAEVSRRYHRAAHAHRVVLIPSRGGSSVQLSPSASQDHRCAHMAGFGQPVYCSSMRLSQLLARLVFTTFGCLQTAYARRTPSLQLKHKVETAGTLALAAGAARDEAKVQLSEPEVLEKVRELAIEATGIDELEIDAPLIDEGLDSLQAVSFRNAVAMSFKMPSLPTSMVVDYPSVRDLAKFLWSQIYVAKVQRRGFVAMCWLPSGKRGGTVPDNPSCTHGAAPLENIVRRPRT